MKYQNLKSFQKQLQSAAPHHLCRFYFLGIQDDFERAKAIDQILSFCSLQMPANRLSGASCTLKECLDSMQSMSLLGDSITVIDEVEKLSKKDLQILSDQFKNASGYLLFGSRSKVASLMSAIEKEGIVLDLLEEKPWDKEKRLIDEIGERVKNAGKRAAPEVAPLLLERLGMEPALLISEIDKLICYVGDRPTIQPQDLLAISPASKTATFWQIAEGMIWEGEPFPSIDSNGFHALLPSLRSQLHLGLCLSTLVEEKRPSDEWGPFLPKLWPKTLEKRLSQAVRLGSPYFRKGLKALFEMELISRSQSTQYEALCTLFMAKLR